jgi:hypothetical protein
MDLLLVELEHPTGLRVVLKLQVDLLQGHLQQVEREDPTLRMTMASLVELEAYLVVPEAFQEEPEAYPAVPEAYPVVLEAYPAVLEAYPAVLEAYQVVLVVLVDFRRSYYFLLSRPQ